VLAVGHSARSLYEHLLNIGVRFTPKDFACGFRVEHPQEVINSIQYGEQYADMVQRGKGLLPVADYRLAVEVPAASRPPDGVDAAGAVVAAELSLPRKQPVFSFCMCPGGQIVPTSTQVRCRHQLSQLLDVGQPPQSKDHTWCTIRSFLAVSLERGGKQVSSETVPGLATPLLVVTGRWCRHLPLVGGL
jgi:hypothetical protein